MIRAVIDLALRNRLLVLLLTVLVSLLGVYAYREMPKDIYPDLNAPLVNIVTICPGMASEDVERLITFPLESLMNGSPGVPRVRSESTTGESVVTVEFDWGMDIYQARQIVSGQLDIVAEQLPVGSSEPVLGPATVVREGGATHVTRDVRVGAAVVSHRQLLTPLPGGGVHVSEVAGIPPALDDLPRVGTVLELPGGLVEAEWFGLGPHETYPDRKRAGLVGRWRAAIDDLFVPYLRPQESGGRSEVRWLELRDAAGDGVRLTMERPLQVSASRYRAADLDASDHLEELSPTAETIVHLDAAHRGVGTASCGPETLEDYLLRPGTYRWAWSIEPVRGALRSAGPVA